MKYTLGIDIGGTEIKAGAFACEKGESLLRTTAPTEDGNVSDSGEPAWLGNVRSLVAEIESELGRAESIGVSAPGLANADGSAIEFMPGRLDGLENLIWSNALGRTEAIPVLNDAHAALLGEIWQGAAREMTDVIMLTLGTGVGGAIVSDGRLMRGHIGRAGHLGHVTVDAEGAPDICGTPGSLEDAIGNAAIQSRSDGRFETTHALVAAYAAGDACAKDIWLRSLQSLGAAIVSLINVVDPEAVIVGGGIAKAGEHLFRPLQEIIDRCEWRPAGHRVKILPAALGEWAGCCGAASLSDSAK